MRLAYCVMASPQSRTRLALLILTLSTFGCYSGNNPLNCNRNSDFPILLRGLNLATAQGPFSRTDVTHGETFSLPVQVLTATGESSGISVTVTPDVPAGFTVSPESADVVLPGGGGAVYVTFAVTAPATGGTENTQVYVGAHRTSSNNTTSSALLTQDRSLTMVPGLVAANLTPNQATMSPGQSASFSVAVTPRGNTSGATPLRAVITPAKAGVSISPTGFSLNLTQGSTTPVTQAFTVLTAANAATGPTFIEIQTASGYVLDRSSLTIAAGTGGNPRFTITASKREVTVPVHTLSEDVSFTVDSVDGFTGLVNIIWATENDLACSPADNNFQLQVRPGIPGRFTRKFYRYDYSEAPNYMSFAAQNTTIGRTEQITITVRRAN